MASIIGALIIFAIVIALMAIGVLVGRKPLQGSCGGLSALAQRNGEPANCEFCGKTPAEQEECHQKRKEPKRAQLG